MTTATPARIVAGILSPRANRTPRDDSYWIRSLEPDDVPAGYLALAIRVVSEVAEHLGIDPTTVGLTMFERCAPAPGDENAAQLRNHDLNGFALPDGEHLFLSAALAVPQLLDTAAHETRHLWQRRQGWTAFHTRPFLERDAREFGRGWARAHLTAEWQKQRPGEPVPKVFV